MTGLLHDPAIRARLRGLRPLYNRVFRRRKDLTRLPAPAEAIAAMDGRGVFLFAFGRCGTTVFAEFLTSHPQVVTFGEVLNEDSYHSYFQDLSRRVLRWWSFRPGLMRAEFYPYLLRLVRGAPDTRCLFDLKLEGLHLIEGNWRLPDQNFEIFDALQDSTAPVILVERRDLVARHVSGQIAARRGAYHSYHGARGAEIAPFAIDLPRLEADIATIRAQTALIRARFAGHPRFAAVAYEEMFEPVPGGDGETRFSPALAARMAALLDVPVDGFDTTPRLQKVTGSDDHDLIVNRDAVEALRAAHLDAGG